MKNQLKQSTLIIVLLLLLPLCIFAQNKNKPNILWLTSEDNSADWLGCYGNPYAETPNLDKLAKEGFQYMHAYCNTSACSPSRSTWITGMNAVSLGTHHQRSRYAIPHDQIKYYPDFLQEAGYYTGNYDKTDYNIGGRQDKECWNNTEKVDWQNLRNQQPFFQVINFHRSHESRINDKLNENKHDPALTKLRPYHPDLPVWRKTYAQYYDSLKVMDNDIGLALQKLEQSGLAENTIVVYVSDHGGVMPRSKRFLYLNSIHCPLLIRIPKKYKSLWPADKPGSRVDRLVSFVDMPRTWISLAGGEVPDNMQGRIFLGKDTEPEKEYHFSFRGRMSDGVDNSRAITTKRYHYIRNYMPYAPWMQYYYWVWRTVATWSWEQLVKEGKATEAQARLFQPKGSEELYDIVNDPDCVRNLIHMPKYAKVTSELRAELRKEQIRINDAGLLPETEMNRLAKQNNTTIYELAHTPSIYNVEALLDAADLALAENTDNLPKLRQMLKSKDVGQRYWGIIGCFLLNDQQGGMMAINDESDEIRAMAAWLLINTGQREKAYACFKDLLGDVGSFYKTDPPSYAVLSVLNILDWMGEDARELLPVIRLQAFEHNDPRVIKNARRVREHIIEKFSRYNY